MQRQRCVEWMWEGSGLHLKLCMLKQCKRKLRSSVVVQAWRAIEVGRWTQGGHCQHSAFKNVGSGGKNLTAKMSDAQHKMLKSTIVLYIIYSKYSLYRLNSRGHIKWYGGKTFFLVFFDLQSLNLLWSSKICVWINKNHNSGYTFPLSTLQY